MPSIRLRRTAQFSVFAVAIAGIAWFAWPRPVPVDLATAITGPMTVTVDDEARTRVRHVYTVSAPIAGRVLRISPPLQIGDRVTADETVLAVMQPPPPSFVDARSREELQAAVAAAEAAVKLAEAEVRRLDAALAFSRSELRRAESLAHSDTISARALEKARLDVDTGFAALASAKAQLEVRRHDLHNARARLIAPGDLKPETKARCCIELKAPVNGRVLGINQESEATVQAGTPLIEIGDPADLEIAAELLSTDAVRIKPGASVQIDGWGGPPLKGRVVRVDPAGFLKVSALGIEEQRVRTIIELVDPPSVWSRLGHDYRVIVHVTIWSNDNALTVPVSALFRKGDNWAVFVIKGGRARTTLVKIDHRNSRAAEILSGVSGGERVVLHPSDRVKDGVRVAQRETQ